MTNKELLEIATQFRMAIEQRPQSMQPITMSSFPRGACGDTSLLLGAYLIDCDVKGFSYICGERGSHEAENWTSHAWLQRGDCIVDITADQFADAPAAVIVLEPSTWHECFDYREEHESDFRRYSGFGTNELHAMYHYLKGTLSFHM